MQYEEKEAWGTGRSPAAAADVERKVHVSHLGEKKNKWPHRWMWGPGERRGEDTDLDVISLQKVN